MNDIPKLRALLGPDAVLLPVRRGEKGPKWLAWPTTTLAQSLDPQHIVTFPSRSGKPSKTANYQTLLQHGNIGVLLGSPSGGLCSVDLDGEEHARAFLNLNPDLSGALRTRGRRGCNVWVKIEGPYPPPGKIADGEGRHVGEWRADGGQTIIAGDHPEGGQYQIVTEAPPGAARWSEIRWPEGWLLSGEKKRAAGPDGARRGADLSVRQKVASELLGDVDWTSATQGWARCPGEKKHTTVTRPEHTCVYLDGAPTLWCVHSSCQEEVKACNSVLRARIFEAESVRVPNGTVTWGQAADKLYEQLGRTGDFFRFGGRVAELNRGEKMSLDLLEPAGAVSRFDTRARFAIWKTSKEGGAWHPAACTREWATVLLEAGERSVLPSVRTLLSCPTLYRNGEELKVAAGGYCAPARVLVTRGAEIPEVGLEEAVAGILGLLEEIDFVDGGDKARAAAALITPALVFAGLLGGRAPADAAEADKSQAGKTYRQRVLAAVYGAEPAQVTQHSGRGVGSMDEALANALASGASFIQMDNLRGRLNSPVVESFLTAARSVQVRLPHRGYIDVNPDNVFLLLSSNGLEMTPDLANRCAIVRQVKRDRTFRRYEGGADLLGHVRLNQGYYLGCVFAIVKEWWGRGHLEDEASRGAHPFAWWAGKLGWISKEILGTGDLLEGHREIQTRTHMTVHGWLRQLSVLIEEMGELGKEQRAGDLVDLSVNGDIPIPGLRRTGGDLQVMQHVGRLMGKMFPAGENHVVLDKRHWWRSVRKIGGRGRSGSDEVRVYSTTSIDIDPFANTPKCAGIDSQYRASGAFVTSFRQEG